MEFDARDQLQALAALPPEPPKPAAPKTSAWSAPFRALPAGVAEIGAMVAEATKASGQALDSTGTAGAGGMFGGQTDAERAQSERMREQIRTRGLQGGSEVSRSLRNVAEGYGPDPLTASKAEQIVFGLTKGVSKAVGYGLTTGPAAPLLFGLDEGLTETDRLQRQGVDNVTAGRVGMVAGGVNAAGMALPVAGATVRQTAALATLGGPASFVAQQMASREILSRADYHDIAATFDPLDPWGLALSSLPYGFGAWAMRSRMRGAPVRAPVRDQAPADGAAGVADTRPTPEPVRPVEAPPMERTPVAHAVQEAMPREAVDAAMVQHITDASQFMRVWESPPVESLASFAARTLPEAAPVRAAAGPDPFLVWLRAQGGVNFADKFDITGEANAIRSNRGGVFRKGGRGIDELAQAAEAEGWLPPGTVADVDGGTPQMRDMIQRAMQGERIAPLADQFAGLEARGRAHADEMRAAEMEQRLRLLGVDPEPARGNADVLQAYLDQHEPRLLAAALAEEAAARRAAALDDFPTPEAQPITAREAMVQNLTHAADDARANPPIKVEAEMWRGPVTENPNFKAWFGASQIVDDAGAPLVLYHGTDRAFDAFDPSALQAEGIHLTADPTLASRYASSRAMGDGGGANVVPVYASASRVKDVEFISTSSIQQAQAEGFDAVRRGGHVVVMRPEQIKSAIGNSGRFDPNSSSLTDPTPTPAARPPADASPRDIADRASAGFRKGKSLEAWLSSATYPGGLRSVIDALGLDVPKGTYIGEAIKRVQAAIGPAPDTGARPVSYVDTRGTGIRLHGTSKAIAALSDQYAMAGDNRNIYGQGFYTTDAADIAAGYMKKGRNGDPALYEVKQKDVPLFDMEAPITEPIKAMLRSTMGDNMPTENAETGAKLTNLREVFDEFRRESQNNGMSRDHVQEVFDSIRTSLEQMGFRGYEHVGGGNTGKQAHNVRIFWFPEQDISITPTTLDRFKTPETADASPPPANRPQEASPASSPKEPALPPIEPGSGPDHAAIQSVRTRANQVVTEAPDLVVGRTEDGQPITAREALERIRQEAQAGTEDTLGAAEAGLLDVAVQCALSLGG